jgi:hypothetical protein
VWTDSNERKRWGSTDDTVQSHFDDVKNGLATDNIPVLGVGDEAFYEKSVHLLWVMSHNRLIFATGTVWATDGLADGLPPAKALALTGIGRL